MDELLVKIDIDWAPDLVIDFADQSSEELSRRVVELKRRLGWDRP